MDARRLAALAAAAPALDRLAAGLFCYAHPCRAGQSLDGRPPLRVAHGRRARQRGDITGAASALAAVSATALPATLPWETRLPAAAAAALVGLPAAATGPLTTLQMTVNGGRVGRSLAAVAALHTLCVSTDAAAVATIAGAAVLAVTTLTARLVDPPAAGGGGVGAARRGRADPVLAHRRGCAWRRLFRPPRLTPRWPRWCPCPRLARLVVNSRVAATTNGHSMR